MKIKIQNFSRTKIIVFVSLTIFLLIAEPTLQDVYMHNPRGSNNRLNEKSAERKNENRLFDSQVKIKI